MKLSGLSILCIDNNIDSLEMLRLTLQLEGANVFVDGNVEAGVLAQGFSAYLIKPVEIDHLIAAISRLVSGDAIRAAS